MDWDSAKSLLKQTYEEWSHDQIPRLAAALSGVALGLMTGFLGDRLGLRPRR